MIHLSHVSEASSELTESSLLSEYWEKRSYNSQKLHWLLSRSVKYWEKRFQNSLSLLQLVWVFSVKLCQDISWPVKFTLISVVSLIILVNTVLFDLVLKLFTVSFRVKNVIDLSVFFLIFCDNESRWRHLLIW